MPSSNVVTHNTSPDARDLLCQIWKESIQNYMRCIEWTKKHVPYFDGFIAKSWLNDLGRYTLKSKVFLCDTPSHAGDNLCQIIMMTSWNGNIFRVTGHLCGIRILVAHPGSVSLNKDRTSQIEISWVVIGYYSNSNDPITTVLCTCHNRDLCKISLWPSR